MATVLKYRKAKLKSHAAATAARSNGDDPEESESESDEDDEGYDTDGQEEELLKAAKHVERARAQQLLFNQLIEEALKHKTENVTHSQRTYMRVGNYCQNLELPFFGAEQPGDTYYMSPLTIN